MRYLLVGCGLLLAGCSGGTSVSWPALSTSPAPLSTEISGDDVTSSSATSTSMIVDDGFCELLAGVGNTLLREDMDDAEVLETLWLGTEYFASLADGAPPQLQGDVRTVAHNQEVLANGFESALIERAWLEEDSFTFPGIDLGARQRMAEYIADNCPGLPSLGSLWEEPVS